MTTLTVRKLNIDLTQGFGRHWHGGDAFRSMYFNALSMSFPVGEQSFIDAVRAGLELLPDLPEHAWLREDAGQFIAQEATHRHVHSLYNAELQRQGLVNHWQQWATRRIEYGRRHKIGALHLLAVTAAYEHFTAVFADGSLRYSNWLDAAEPKMQTLWRWHAAEETEHRALAFDLYQALGGNYKWRIRWYVYAMLFFSIEAMSQTTINLWHDGTLFRPRTWWGAARFFFGKNGTVWRSALPILTYFRRDFHPAHDGKLEPTPSFIAEAWLKSHAESYRVVR